MGEVNLSKGGFMPSLVLLDQLSNNINYDQTVKRYLNIYAENTVAVNKKETKIRYETRNCNV